MVTCPHDAQGLEALTNEMGRYVVSLEFRTDLRSVKSTRSMLCYKLLVPGNRSPLTVSFV